jgi:segregation and condensation protein B
MSENSKFQQILELIGSGQADCQLVSLLQSLIFASDYPVTIKKLKEILSDYELEEIEKALIAIFTLHESMGIRLNRMGGGYLFTTAPQSAHWIRKFLGGKSSRLSAASLETLAIIAYMQPATQLQVNDIRGVTSDSSLKLLMDKGLIKTVGRKNEPGRPILYATTREFMTFFGLNSLTELPDLDVEGEDKIPDKEDKAVTLLKDLITSSRIPSSDDDSIDDALGNLTGIHKSVETLELKLMTALGMNQTDETGKDPEENNNGKK